MPRFLPPASILGIALGVAAAPMQAAGRDCASTLPELRALMQDPLFPLLWRETTMRDGKPMVVTIGELQGQLFLQFEKTREGTWAEGAARVCMDRGEIVATIGKEQMRLGMAAPWLLRQSLGQGARFVLARAADGQLRIATPGWSSTFSPLAGQ